MNALTDALRMLFRAAAYAAFALAIGYFSAAPPYQYGTPGAAVLKLSVSHATQRVEPCVLLTPEQIAALAPNMRRTQQCQRERLPLRVELELDGALLASLQASPAGLWGDGPASVYRRFDLPPGHYRLTARIRDSARADGWDYTHTEDVSLRTGRYLTVTFRAETGGFSIR